MTKYLSLEPQNVDAHTWYYEERKGITVCVELPDKSVVQCMIPWRLIQASAARQRKSACSTKHTKKD